LIAFFYPMEAPMLQPPPPPPEPNYPVQSTGDAASSQQGGDQMIAHVADCLHRGSSPAEVRTQLVAMGVDANTAHDLVEAVRSHMHAEAPYITPTRHGRPANAT
jgi:hypothetical protein